MKVGSLVEYIGASNIHPNFTWVPEKGSIYTIRFIDTDYIMPYAFLEEGVVGLDFLGREMGIGLGCLREVQPPEEGVMLIEEVNTIEELV